ncbi:MAG TPA: hypothetical protein VFX43_00615 [Chitinophagaceae bacterium]|nr:hypothetical protein [Chitinophagaceae bacterium]
MYKRYTCLIAWLLFTCSVYAQSADSLVAMGMRLEQGRQEAKALQMYKAALKIDSTDLKALSRASILSMRAGNRQVSPELKAVYFDAAKEYATNALKKDPDDKEANLAMAMALQQLSLTAGAKQKAGYLKAVKTYTDKALLIDSAYGRAWYVQGNWNYQVSSLNFAEKAATRLLFGRLPQASMDQAIADYQKCLRLDPSFILNLYKLAGAYHAKGKDLKAISTLRQALRLRPVLQDDHKIQDDCRKMIQSLE